VKRSGALIVRPALDSQRKLAPDGMESDSLINASFARRGKGFHGSTAASDDSGLHVFLAG
jgi:hypothetical protein